MCLIPLAIIIPLYLSSQESMKSILKIGAYLYVFYDEKGFRWEKRNNDMASDARKKISKTKTCFENSLPHISLVVICCLLCLYKILFANQYSKCEMRVRVIIVIALLVISIIIILRQYVYVFETRERFISFWKSVKMDEISKEE